MSQTDVTTTEKVSALRILAELLLVGHEHRLPDPIGMEATYGNGCGHIQLASFADQDAWVAVLDAKPGSSFVSKDGERNVRMFDFRRHGWFITIDASEPVQGARRDLDGDELAVLAEIANPPAPKPVVSDDRAEEVRAGLNGFIDHEYESGTEIRDGVAVPVRTIVGTDFNLGKAVDWALEQPEVSIACGPAGGSATVELVDGTVIACFGEQWEFEARALP